MQGNGKHRPSVLIIYENPRVAVFLEGVLRYGFRVDVARDGSNALELVEKEPPDLILCDIRCLKKDDWGRSGAPDDYYGLFEIPMILVLGNQQQYYAEMVKMRFGAVDCVHESIPPRLLRWKVRNWVYLKDQVNLLRELENQARDGVRKVESQMETLVHDLKSPVVALRGFVKVLRRRLASLGMDSRTSEIMQQLDGVSRAIEDLVEESHQIISSREVELEPEIIELDHAIVEVVHRHQQLTKSKHIEVQIKSSESTGSVKGRRSQIKQVIENLLINAIRHMGSQPEPRILITTSQTGKSLITTVSDNGVGIPHEYQTRIFDRFFQVPGSDTTLGTGLGLSIVKEIVEGLQGQVWVESEPGYGATFNFSLPRAGP